MYRYVMLVPRKGIFCSNAKFTVKKCMKGFVWILYIYFFSDPVMNI